MFCVERGTVRVCVDASGNLTIEEYASSRWVPTHHVQHANVSDLYECLSAVLLWHASRVRHAFN